MILIHIQIFGKKYIRENDYRIGINYIRKNDHSGTRFRKNNR